MSGPVTSDVEVCPYCGFTAGGHNEVCVAAENVRLRQSQEAYRDALIKLVDHVNECVTDSEGKWPKPEAWCFECTGETVPEGIHKLLCAHHGAEKLLCDNPPKVNYGPKR